MLRLNAVFLLLLPAFAHSAEEWPYPEDTPRTSPVTVGLAGEQPADIVRYLLAEGATAAKLSPDGETVAFRWAVSGEPQLWLVAADGGFPRQLTFGGSVTFFEWTPDGAHLLVARDANGNEREGYNLLSLDGTSERQILPQTAAFRSFGAFSPDGTRFTYSSTERNGLDYDIYIADLETADTRLVYQGSYQFNVAGWQPDGSLLIVTEDRGEDAHDVHLLDIDTGEFKTLFKPDVAAAHTNFEWLPDGSGFYMATNVDREFTGLARYSLQTDTLEYVETPDADISNVDLSLDGRVLSWVTNEDGYSRLHALDLETNEALQTPELQDGVYTLNAAKAVGRTAIRVSGPATPGDIIVWDLASGDTTRPFAAKQMLRAGVTSAIDLGTPFQILALRDRIRAGEIPGPRLTIAGPWITRVYLDGLPAEYQLLIDSPREAAARTRELIERGSDVIKTWVGLTEEDYRAVVREAHAQGVKVHAHLYHPDAMWAAINAGVDVFQHAGSARNPPYDEELVSRIAHDRIPIVQTISHRIWVYPATVEFPSRLLDPVHRDDMPADIYAEVMDSFANFHRLSYFHDIGDETRNAQKSARQFIDAGAYMGVGTDAASPLNFHTEAMWYEMKALVESGMTPIQVISAATKTNAEILGQFDELGTLEPGKLADIIVVDGNPLADIDALSRIDIVVKDGGIWYAERAAGMPVTDIGHAF